MGMIRSITCLETLDGVILMWELLDNVRLSSVVVYGMTKDREFEVVDPLIETGRCFVPRENTGLADNYKLKLTNVDGFEETTRPIQPTEITKAARILLREIRRRERIIMRSNPFGAYKFTILLKKQYGEGCPSCGRGRCAGYGGNSPINGCPTCIGTGQSNPYIVYPTREYMLPVTPKEDAKTSPPGVERLATIRTLRTVFDYIIREDDIVVTGNEAYIVVQQQVAASVGNTPAVYQLNVVQILPEDERYPALMELCKQAR